MNDIILIYIPVPSKDIAKKIAKDLLKQKLIVCANIFPIESLYWWEGKIEEGKELVLLVKTTNVNFEKVRCEVEKIHPYETSAIIKIAASTNDKYFQWLKENLK